MQALTLTDAQTLAVESLAHEGEITTADTILLLVERNDLLVRLIRDYQPTWFFQMGKTGYECSFCRALFDNVSHMHQHEGHAEGCPLPDAMAVLLGTKDD